MDGEPLVVLDLVDTLGVVNDPPIDLIANSGQYRRWWELEKSRLPAGPLPASAAVRRLRAIVRFLFDAHVRRETPDPVAVENLNATATSAPLSKRMDGWGPDAPASFRWHDDHQSSPALALAATEATDLLTHSGAIGSDGASIEAVRCFS
ncbi:MAG TPA: ABATE domain-containing protein [Pseudonocardiaceae bacterium]|nr:ABATE domain-containing protein [Pseudonocardiaceae bacterium]